MTTAIVPIKTFTRAKSRLGGDPELAASMAHDVLQALAQVRSLKEILVVSRERFEGFDVVHDPFESGHSEAAVLGIEAAVARGARRVLLVPGDCPLLDAVEVDALLEFAGPGVTIVPDRHGSGTNALVLDPPSALTPSFGPGSFARHAALARAAGVPFSVRDVPSLAFDVDTPEDLDALQRVT